MAGIPLVSIRRTLTEAAKKNNARKVKKKWTAGEPRPSRNVLNKMVL